MDLYRVLEHKIIDTLSVYIPFAPEPSGIYAALLYIFHKCIFRHGCVSASSLYIHPARVAILSCHAADELAHQFLKLVDITTRPSLFHILCITS